MKTKDKSCEIDEIPHRVPTHWELEEHIENLMGTIIENLKEILWKHMRNQGDISLVKEFIIIFGLG
jgi:hypothetical protein